MPSAEYMREYRKRKKNNEFCSFRVKPGKDGYVNFKKIPIKDVFNILDILENPENLEFRIALTKTQEKNFRRSNVFELIDDVQ